MICYSLAPQGLSVNDFNNPNQFSIKYTSFDDTIRMIRKLGCGALLGKKMTKLIRSEYFQYVLKTC